jgi:hypothetical protein
VLLVQNKDYFFDWVFDSDGVFNGSILILLSKISMGNESVFAQKQFMMVRFVMVV